MGLFWIGAAKSKIFSETYSSDWQDFLAANSSVLDTWVYDRFEKLVQDKNLPPDENSLIFLHLLGIDNTGHATKPHSRYLPSSSLVITFLKYKLLNRKKIIILKHNMMIIEREYKDGMRIVDDIVSKVETNIAHYYRDSKTLFVFTADHGMTDWGTYSVKFDSKVRCTIQS
jgi:phosphatidylinositol glycan class N